MSLVWQQHRLRLSLRASLSATLALAGLLLSAQAAFGVLQGGYDEATRKLEEGFKIVATERIGSDTECYPAPEEIAALLRREMGIEVVLASNLDSVQGFDLVNVIREETECNRLVLAIRAGAKGRVFVLDSDYGPVYVQGGGGLSEESLAGGTGPLRDLTAATSVFRMHSLDETARFEVHCPEGTSPLGGGMFNATPLGGDGEGIYPHSYERLGVQSGFHVTATLIDPSTARTTPHRGRPPGDLRTRARPDRLAARDDLRQAARDGDRDGSLSRGHPALLRRLPAHQLHDARESSATAESCTAATTSPSRGRWGRPRGG